jgi:predicted enzyme related to lactoylglutathione lyase
MNLVSIRIITSSTESLAAFYEQITGLSAIRYTPDFAELKTQNTTLAIGSIKTLQFFGGESIAQPAENRTAIIEFLVDDVDKEFERLKSFLSSKVVV